MVTDKKVIAAIDAEFSATVREAARVATLRRLGVLPAPAPKQPKGSGG